MRKHSTVGGVLCVFAGCAEDYSQFYIAMKMPESRRPLRPEVWSIAALVIVFVIALTVLIGGWAFGLDTLRRLYPDYAAMVPSTAVSFLLLASVLLWQQLAPPSARIALISQRLVAGLVGAIALADLAVIFSGTGNGIDGLIWTHEAEFQSAAMAPATAFCFLFAVICVFRLGGSPRGDLSFVFAGTIGLLMALIAVVGYAFDARALYDISIFTAMALHTAISFVLLFIGLLLMRPEVGWVDTLFSDETGSAGARRLLPIAIMAPLAFCLIALVFTEARVFAPNFRLSLLAIAMMAVLAATVLHNAAIENASQRRMRILTEELRVAIGDRDLFLREVYHRVKNNLEQINALIQIESRRVKDEAAKTALGNTARRVRALGAVHRTLMAADIPSQLDVVSFLNELCNSIAANQNAARRGIVLHVTGDDVQLHVDLAVSIGLIVSELVTGAFKRDFHHVATGEVLVGFIRVPDGAAVLTVADNGDVVATMEGRSFGGGGTGGQIVRGLVGQLGATMDIDMSKGMRVDIMIPERTIARRNYD